MPSCRRTCARACADRLDRTVLRGDNRGDVAALWPTTSLANVQSKRLLNQEIAVDNGYPEARMCSLTGSALAHPW